MNSAADEPALARRLSTGDAIVIGLSAMLGAGLFAVFAPAADAAGSWLLAALGVAALVATCNALASAQLATAYPTSGGTYVYGREVLGARWGFAAGWSFVVGKSASCAAMAWTAATYLAPGNVVAQRGIAAAAVVIVTVAAVRGVMRTAQVARWLLGSTLVVATGVIVLGVAASWGTSMADGVGRSLWSPNDLDVYGILQAAGLLFFAFAGYARMATLAEEIQDPARMSRAIITALAIVVVLYAAMAWMLLSTLGADLSSASAPVAQAMESAGHAWAAPVIRVGAVTASLGALLALLVGVSRTALAMARSADLPRGLAHVHPTHQVPVRATVAVSVVVLALVLLGDLRGSIGFSSAGVLLYYAITNLCAMRQPRDQRRWPTALNVVGLTGCLTLVATLPVTSTLAAVMVIILGSTVRTLARK